MFRVSVSIVTQLGDPSPSSFPHTLSDLPYSGVRGPQADLRDHFARVGQTRQQQHFPGLRDGIRRRETHARVEDGVGGRRPGRRTRKPGESRDQNHRHRIQLYHLTKRRRTESHLQRRTQTLERNK